MKKYFLTILILAVFCISSCDIYITENLRSFVWVYYEAESIRLYETDDGNIAIDYDDIKTVCDFKSKKQQKKLYDSLCYAHNDVGYNKTITYFPFPDDKDAAGLFINDIVLINVVSNADFDEQHPAGTLLNDIIRFAGTSINEFLQSNYIYQYDWNNKPANFPAESRFTGFTYESPVNKLLSEITPKDLLFLTTYSWFGFLLFEKEPTLSKEHELTVTVVLDNGKVLSAHSMDGNSKKPTIRKVFE